MNLSQKNKIKLERLKVNLKIQKWLTKFLVMTHGQIQVLQLLPNLKLKVIYQQIKPQTQRMIRGLN